MIPTGTSGPSVYLGGYTLDGTGLRMWPLRKYTGHWIDLADLQVRRADGQHAHYLLVFQFSTRARPVKVRVGAGIANLRRLAEVFEWIRQAAPLVRESSRGLLEEFKSVVGGVGEDGLSVEHPSDEERLARARVWWMALDPKRALRECKVLIRDRGPVEVEAAMLAIDAQLASSKLEDAVATFEDVLARHRDHPKLLARGAALLLDHDDVRGESLAEEVVSRDSIEAPRVGVHWALHHFRARRWDAALAVLDRVEQRARPLPEVYVDEFAWVRNEVAACRANPTRGFRQTVGRRWLAFSLQIGIPMLGLALMAWPIVEAGPVFHAEARKLALLEATGVRVDVTCVRDVRRYDLRETELSELSFVFSPDPATAEPWEITDIWALDPAGREAYFDRITSGRPPRGWYRGQAILYDSTAKEIERDDSRRFVTCLREDPSVNTIGPITWTRVWLTWLAGGKAAFMAVMAGAILVYLALLAFLDVLRSRMRRRRDSL